MTETHRTRSDSEIEDDIERLRGWLYKQPHLPKDVDKELLAAYVHGTKSLEIGKQKLDGYLSCRSRAPHLFTFPARDPSSAAFKEASGAVKVFFLPRKTGEGHLVLMVVFDLDFSKFDHTQYVVRLMMMMEMAMLRYPDAAGMELVADAKGIDSSLLTKASVTTAAFLLHWFQSTIPMKLKRGVAINTPKFFETIVNTLFKPFLSKKLFGRLVFTSEGEKAYRKYIAEELLPFDFGGEERSSGELNDYWLQELEKNRDWFLETSRQLVDESKRPPDQHNTFGLDGTFRSLSID